MAKIRFCSDEQWNSTPAEMGFPSKESSLAPSPIVGVSELGDYRRVHTVAKAFNMSIGALKEAGLPSAEIDENTYEASVKGYKVRITPIGVAPTE